MVDMGDLVDYRGDYYAVYNVSGPWAILRSIHPHFPVREKRVENNSKIKKISYKDRADCIGLVVYDGEGVCLIVDESDRVVRFLDDSIIYDIIETQNVVPLTRWKIENALTDWM
jgi:hypothetical protein